MGTIGCHYMTIEEFITHLCKWLRENQELKNLLVCDCAIAGKKDEDNYVPGSVLIELGSKATDEGWDYDGTLNITQTVINKYVM